MKPYFHFLCIELWLLLVGLMLSTNIMANDVAPLTSSQKNTENSAIAPDQAVEVALPEQASMTWSLQPGESLNDVARLFSLETNICNSYLSQSRYN